jgi:predicted PurR-regulated permease PerM
VRRTAFVAAIVLGTALVVGALWALAYAVVLFLLSIALSAALRPSVDALRRRGWPLQLALGTVYAAALLAGVGLLVLLGGELLVELPRAADQLLGSYERAHRGWPHGAGWQQALVERLPPPRALYDALKEVDGEVAAQAATTSLGVLGLLGEIFVVVSLALYWSASRDTFERLWLSMLAVETRVRARMVWTAVRVAAGAHLRRELGLSLLAGAILATGFRLAGVSFWGIAAVVVVVARLVPLIGLPLATLGAAAVGAADGPALAIAAGGGALVFLVGARVIAPRLFAAPDLPPLLAVLVMLGLARHHGFAGLLVAPLLTATIHAAFVELTSAPPASTAPAATIDELAERVEAIRAAAGDAAPETQSLVERARALIARARASDATPSG